MRASMAASRSCAAPSGSHAAAASRARGGASPPRGARPGLRTRAIAAAASATRSVRISVRIAVSERGFWARALQATAAQTSALSVPAWTPAHAVAASSRVPRRSSRIGSTAPSAPKIVGTSGWASPAWGCVASTTSSGRLPVRLARWARTFSEARSAHCASSTSSASGAWPASAAHCRPSASAVSAIGRSGASSSSGAGSNRSRIAAYGTWRWVDDADDAPGEPAGGAGAALEVVEQRGLAGSGRAGDHARRAGAFGDGGPGDVLGRWTPSDRTGAQASAKFPGSPIFSGALASWPYGLARRASRTCWRGAPRPCGRSRTGSARSPCSLAQRRARRATCRSVSVSSPAVARLAPADARELRLRLVGPAGGAERFEACRGLSSASRAAPTAAAALRRPARAAPRAASKRRPSALERGRDAPRPLVPRGRSHAGARSARRGEAHGWSPPRRSLGQAP